jgi:hypothetical protein
MKKESHTGIRNEKLFCFHCGTSQVMPVPMPVYIATAMIKAFEKNHRSCKKTWTELVHDPDGKSEWENERWWIANGEHGISSKTMFNILSDDNRIQNLYQSHPHDPDDFRRCYLLLQSCPHFVGKLQRMRSVSPTWSNLVDNWERLTEMLEWQFQFKKANGMLEFMDSLVVCNSQK